jgi:hypothetical protein
MPQWWFRERDNSSSDGIGEDRGSLLRLPLYSTMAVSIFNLAATGRVAKEFLLVITSALSEPSFPITTGIVSLSLYSS